MKTQTVILALVTVAFTAVTLTANAVDFTVEPGAVINDKIDKGKLEALVGLTRYYGYRCDTVSAALPHFFSNGYTLRCNKYRYEYEIEDKGGTWKVTPE